VVAGAPPTESSASTSGTPAANMVDSVRVQRATVALRMIVADDREAQQQRSTAICIAVERL
jgi:hypothetical protein